MAPSHRLVFAAYPVTRPRGANGSMAQRMSWPVGRFLSASNPFALSIRSGQRCDPALGRAERVMPAITRTVGLTVHLSRRRGARPNEEPVHWAPRAAAVTTSGSRPHRSPVVRHQTGRIDALFPTAQKYGLTKNRPHAPRCVGGYPVITFIQRECGDVGLCARRRGVIPLAGCSSAAKNDGPT